MIALHNTLKFTKNSDGETIATNGSYNFIIYRPKIIMGREIFWVCYTWPVEKGVTGERAMVVCDYQWQKLYLLQGLPGIGRKSALLLLKHFGCVEKVFTATQEELCCVDGIGKITAQKIRAILTEFEGNSYEQRSNLIKNKFP